MLPKAFKILLGVCSLVAVASCRGHGPLITVCVSDPVNNQFVCRDKKQKEFFLKFEDSENYVAIPPRDFQTLLNYCENKSQ